MYWRELLEGGLLLAPAERTKQQKERLRTLLRRPSGLG